MVRSPTAVSRFTGKHHPDWFQDTDRALEWAERKILEEAGAGGTKREVAIGDFALMAGLAPDELEFLKPYLDRQLFPARVTLFHSGEPGERLYLLARGGVSLLPEDRGIAGRHGRIVTLAPGVIFGESAILEGGLRSMTAVSEEEIVVYSFARKSLEAIREIHPDLHRRLLLNLLHHLSGLLRMTAGVLRETGDRLD
jgi:CRP-like cAMP-binding protein